MSYRLAPAAMSSIAQQAKPIGIGHSEFLRNQLMAASTRVWTTSPSILELYPNSVDTGAVGECAVAAITRSRIRRQSLPDAAFWNGPNSAASRFCDFFHKVTRQSKSRVTKAPRPDSSLQP